MSLFIVGLDKPTMGVNKDDGSQQDCAEKAAP